MKITFTIELPTDEMSNMQYLHIANYLDRSIQSIKDNVKDFEEKEFFENKTGVSIKCEIGPIAQLVRASGS